MSKHVGVRPAFSIPSRLAAGPLRTALIAGVAFAFVVGLAGSSQAASRRDREAEAERVKKREMDKKEPFGKMPTGPLQIVVSIANQRVTLYSNGTRVAQGPVSTGVPGHPTPMGVFSVIEKDRFHHSNLYSNAPMPFMQRITWSGVAMHEGALPGGPASHGCIRLSRDFASRLWLVTKLGARVIVSRNDVVPTDFDHPRLFVPKPKPAEPAVADKAAPDAVQVASVPAKTDAPDAAAKTDPETGLALKPSLEVTPVSATATPEPTRTAEIVVEPPASDATPFIGPVKLPVARPKVATVKPNGHVAVFISRKDKRLYVRQGFVPLFDMEVEIANADQPLGTHVFTALELKDDGKRMRWNAITMPAEQPRQQERSSRDERRRKAGREQPKPVIVEVRPPQTATQALDRIQIPQEAVDRIDEILSVGSSLTVSDQGLGNETGRYTDFIVVTR